jgi:PKD-like domain
MFRLSVPLLAVLLCLAQVASAQTCPLPSAAITFAGSANDGYICGGLPLNAEVPDAGDGATYEWTVSSPYVVISGGQGTRAITMTTRNELGNPSSSLSVTVTNACGTNSSQRTFNTIPVFETYSVSFNPPLTPIGIGPVGCANAAYHASLTFFPTLLSPPERTYEWKITNGTISKADRPARSDGRSFSRIAAARSACIRAAPARSCSRPRSTRRR